MDFRTVGTPVVRLGRRAISATESTKRLKFC